MWDIFKTPLSSCAAPWRRQGGLAAGDDVAAVCCAAAGAAIFFAHCVSYVALMKASIWLAFVSAAVAASLHSAAAIAAYATVEKKDGAHKDF